MSRKIEVPDGADIRILTLAPYSVVVIAPAPLQASAALFSTPGGTSALFTHGPGLHWPDDRNCRLAGVYLSEGVPIALQFGCLADALMCQSRLRREMAQ